MNYFLIVCGEDGLYAKGPLTKEQLQEHINPEDNGPMSFLSSLEISDGQLVIGERHTAWGQRAVIIKGEIIVPQPRTVVIDYDIQ